MDKKTMRFSCLVKKGESEIRERPLGEMQPDQVLVKQLACNICTTDYGQWNGLREHQGYPHANGHEGSGIIIDKGSRVSGLEIGDMVAMAYDGCGECESCRQGDYAHCVKLKGRWTEDGYIGGFGFSDYCVRDARSLVKMNPDMDPGAAAFLEPLATVVRGIKKLRLKPMETVVVIGAGTMGLLNAQVAGANGARVIVSELMDKKLDTARAMGFEVINSKETDPVQAVRNMTNGKGADCVIVAVGNTIANKQALEMVKYTDGRILLFAAGYPAPSLEIGSNEIHYRRLELLGTFEADVNDFLTAGRLLSDYIVDVSKLIEEPRFTLDTMQEAYKHASIPGMYRVSVIINEK